MKTQLPAKQRVVQQLLMLVRLQKPCNRCCCIRCCVRGAACMRCCMRGAACMRCCCSMHALLLLLLHAVLHACGACMQGAHGARSAPWLTCVIWASYCSTRPAPAPSGAASGAAIA